MNVMIFDCSSFINVKLRKSRTLRTMKQEWASNVMIRITRRANPILRKDATQRKSDSNNTV